MLIEHLVNGSEETSVHTFSVNLNGLDINISKGKYIQNKIEKFTLNEILTVTIPLPEVHTHYELWLAEDGIEILTRTDEEEFDLVANPVDRLLWFSISTGETDLNNVDVHFIKVVDTVGS